MKNDGVNQKMLFTKDGLAQLKRELDELVHIKRPEAVKRVAAARDQGDLSENSEYAAAREDLSFIDGRIVELEEILRGAKIIAGHGTGTTVDLGSSVTIHIDGREDIFMIVGEWEANPKEKKISHSSPLGKALIGKKVGETIKVDAPAGKITYKIIAITR